MILTGTKARRTMKLIRDKVPEIMKKEGKNPITRTASDTEFVDALNVK